MIKLGLATVVCGALFAATAIGASAIVSGCGGESPPPKVATKPSGDAGTSTASGQADQPVTNAQGQEVGVSEGPDQHPELSGPAKDAYNRGWTAWQAGDMNGAKAAFTDATQKDPHAPAPHYSLGVVLERLGNVPDAQQEYRAAFTFKPDYELAMGAYALSLAYAGHAGEADTFLTDKHNRNPNSARLSTYLSMVKSIAGDDGSAQSLAQDALRLDPNNTGAMVAIARDYYRAHKMDLALYALRAILDGLGDSPPRDKDNPEAHLLRGLIEKQDGKRAAAMVDFQAAQAKRPDLVEATIQLGVMKLEAGNALEATPLLETAVKYAPTDPMAHLNLGDSYRLAGRTADAKRELEAALQLDSTQAVAHYDLGLLYLFSPSVPGFQPLDQVAQAIKEIETYKTMHTKATPGQTDDSDDLLSRAKAKQAELKTPAPAAAPPPAPAAASTTDGGK